MFLISTMLPKKILSILIIVTFFSFHGINGAKILGLFPVHGLSHFVTMEPILRHLAEKGHEVDVVSHFPQKTPLPRYRDISIRGTIPLLTGNLSIQEASSFKDIDMITFHRMFFQDAGTRLCEEVFKAKLVQDLYRDIDKTKYDLILTELFGTDCFYVFAHKLKNVPVVGIATCTPMSWLNDRFGLPDNPAYLSNVFLNLSSPIPFYQRIYNTLVTFGSKWGYYYFQSPVSDQILRKYLDDETIPPMYELENRSSLFLINTHYSLHGARPLPPNVKEIAGVHLTSFRPLPQNVEQFLNNSKNGVILFTLGSLVQIETAPPETQRAFIDAFGELPYDVIWKANNSQMMGPFPKNIYFQSWVPQREILCHPNTKLFITHGGSMGTQEAIYCGVPMVGIPLFGDQPLNIAKYIKKGIAVELKWGDISKENVLNALNTILKDSSYAKRMKHLSEIYRDRPMPVLDEITYWIEYVIRHNGAYHLRPASVELAWYQLYLLDVFLVLIGILILILTIIYLLISLVYRKLRKVKRNEKLKTQ